MEEYDLLELDYKKEQDLRSKVPEISVGVFFKKGAMEGRGQASSEERQRVRIIEWAYRMKVNSGVFIVRTFLRTKLHNASLMDKYEFIAHFPDKGYLETYAKLNSLELPIYSAHEEGIIKRGPVRVKVYRLEQRWIQCWSKGFEGNQSCKPEGYPRYNEEEDNALVVTHIWKNLLGLQFGYYWDPRNQQTTLWRIFNSRWGMGGTTSTLRPAAIKNYPYFEQRYMDMFILDMFLTGFLGVIRDQKELQLFGPNIPYKIKRLIGARHPETEFWAHYLTSRYLLNYSDILIKCPKNEWYPQDENSGLKRRTLSWSLLFYLCCWKRFVFYFYIFDTV
ncbi:hypothetical protein ACJX0J_009148 [Zea mays]